MSALTRRLLGGIGAVVTAAGLLTVGAPAQAEPLTSDTTASVTLPCGGAGRIDFRRYDRVSPVGTVQHFGEIHNCYGHTVRVRVTFDRPPILGGGTINGMCATVRPGAYHSESSVQATVRGWNYC